MLLSERNFAVTPPPVTRRAAPQRAAYIMRLHFPSRLLIAAACFVLLAATPGYARGRGRGQKAQQSPTVLKPARPQAQPQMAPRAAARAAAQDHIPQWMASHSNLPLADQQKALEGLPGFHELPAQTQQRYRDLLGRLNSMNPQQRARIVDRNEALERLSPPQRQEWRDAVQQLNASPVPRRRLMARAILDLREMPPEQREQTIDSPAFGTQFSPNERNMIRTLLTAEPYPPTTTAAER